MVTLPEQEAKLRTTKNPSPSMLNTWFNLLLQNDLIFVMEAQNEQNPIGDYLKYPVRPMPLKSESHYDQVGDYIFKVKNTWGSFVVERKSVADLYGTLFSKNQKTGEKQRERLYREIGRFYADDRFDQFIVMVEGTYEEYLKYTPLRERNTEIEEWVKISKLLGAKKASINSLQVRPGVQVVFCGSRGSLIEQYEDMIRQWTLQHWEMILND